MMACDLVDRTSILSVEQAVYRPNSRIFVSFRPSNVTGVKGICGEDTPIYGHVELNLKRGQGLVQAGACLDC